MSVGSFGTTVIKKNKGVPLVKIDNTRPTVLILASENTGINYYLYDDLINLEQDLEQLKLKDTEYLNDLKAANFSSQIAIITYHDDTLNTTQNCLDAIDKLNDCENALKIRAFWVLCDLDSDDTYFKLHQNAVKMGFIFFHQLSENTESAILTKTENYPVQQAIISYQLVTRIGGGIRPLKAFLLARYSELLASEPYAFGKSLSSKYLKGITAINTIATYLEGEDTTADRLRANYITMVVSDDGFKIWGCECKIQKLEDDFADIRTGIIINEYAREIKKILKKVNDEDLELFSTVFAGITDFNNRLIANKVVAYGKISIDLAKNTETSLAGCEISIDFDIQERPVAKKIYAYVNRVTGHLGVIIENIQKAAS